LERVEKTQLKRTCFHGTLVGRRKGNKNAREEKKERMSDLKNMWGWAGSGNQKETNGLFHRWEDAKKESSRNQKEGKKSGVVVIDEKHKRRGEKRIDDQEMGGTKGGEELYAK